MISKGKLGSSSFRRVLLSRILLLTIPILLTGEYLVYRKARSGVLATARSNLMESAVRKAADIQTLTAMMRSTLLVSSQTFIATRQTANTPQAFVDQMKTWLPEQVECVQLSQVATGMVTGSTCGMSPIVNSLPSLPNQRSTPIQPADVLISRAFAPSAATADLAPSERQLSLVFSVPIYDVSGSLKYVLSAQTNLQQQQYGQKLSLQGYTVVIDQNGVILAHPISERIGQTVAEQPNAAVLQGLVKSAIGGEQNSLHLFEENGMEWLAGYTAMQIPTPDGAQETWVILALAPVANALHEIRELQQVLVLLTLALLLASLFATLVVTRDLATPLEKLSTYALQIRDRSANAPVPKSFRIRELNQLADALDVMIQQLDSRAEELETAWREAQAANQLKSEFLATTSHELRTPLNAIIGSVRLVRDGCCDSPEEVVEFLQQADDAAIHLLKIINDLLDISRIEVGQIELNLQPVNIQALCEQCLKMVQPSAEKKRLHVSSAIAHDLTAIPLDERRVRQMVINLLSNAVKFTPEGGFVKLRAWRGSGVQLEQENRPDRSPVNPATPYLCLEVTDSGIGIAPERWHLLFRPFQQIDASSTRNYEGTGLGLSLTKRLVELHGGTLSFDSTPGKGSTFRIWLPMPQALS